MHTADEHGVICETYGENVIAIITCANWFKWFKKGDFDISDKERSQDALQLWKRTNCEKMEKNRKKQ